MISHILDKMNVQSANRPAIGQIETTMIQCPYEIKKNLFLWDMPGLGGENFLNGIYNPSRLNLSFYFW